MGKIVVAIDGYSGCGKSSTAKAVAKDLGFTYIDSGAMYRAATLHFLNNFLSVSNPNDVAKGLRTLDISFHLNPDTGIQDTYLNGLNVEDEIRSMAVSQKVSEIATIKEIRKELVPDAVEIDTSNLTFERQVAQIVQLAKDVIDKEKEHASNH
jgi:cytidylate kinase